MQNHESFQPFGEVPPLANEVGNNYMHFPYSSYVPTVIPPPSTNLVPVPGIDFQPSEVCPKNFIIFDQTEQRSQIMYNPAMAHKFGNPYLNINATCTQENFKSTDNYDLEREISYVKEDSEDIDALLSLEEEEQEEYDDEEVSTARTYGSNSPDSCSSYCSKPRKNSSSYAQKSSTGATSSNCERKRQKMKKMVKALKGIVPGGDHMDTVTVLDEAVKYLKSLKVDVQKLGVRDFNN